MFIKIRNYLSLVVFQHTIFALPFALLGFFLGVYEEQQKFNPITFIYVLLCMVTARNTAMSFNRLVDVEFDKKNLRTQKRPIPAGLLNKREVMMFIVLNIGLFVFATYKINMLCFCLSPVALFVIMGYSFTKRFSFLCHLILGVGLGLAPVGAFIAVTNYFSLYIVLLGFSVVFWVAGFDIIYALQDYEFDKQQKLFSIPVWLGLKKALQLARVFHVMVVILLLMFATYIHAEILLLIGLTFFATFLIRQHKVVNLNQLEKIEASFFKNNGIASLLFCGLAILDLLFFKG